MTRQCRYGDEQHLDEALQRIFLIGRPKGLPKRQCPRLKGLREELVDGNYALVLEFENKNKMTAEQWTERQDKFGSFFGPGVTAQVWLPWIPLQVVIRQARMNVYRHRTAPCFVTNTDVAKALAMCRC